MKLEPLAVFGIFETRVETERAIEQLQYEKFPMKNISILLHEVEVAQTMTNRLETKATTSAMIGAGVGLAVGGVFSLLAASGALIIPGVRTLIAVGPLVTWFTSLGLGGALGGLSGALIGMGISEAQARRYEAALKNGALLLCVHVDNVEQAMRVRRILHFGHGKDLYSAYEMHPTNSRTKETPAVL